MVLCQLQPHLQITRTTSLRRVSNAKLPTHHRCAPKETTLVGTNASNEKPNASGLTPDQTRALPERSVDPDGPEALIIRSLRELYSCKSRNVRLCLPYPHRVSEPGLRRDHMKFTPMTQSSMTLLGLRTG